MARRRNQKDHRRFAGGRERYVSHGKKWAVVLAAAAVVGVGLLTAALVNGWISLPQNTPDKPSEPPAQNSADQTLRLVFGGDVNITDKMVAAGGSTLDYTGVFLDILPALSASDLTVVNLEGNVCGAPYGSAQRSAPVQLLQALRSSGVDILQTANSHSLTNGLRGLRDTNTAIRDAGMQPLGTFADEAEYEQYQGYLAYEINGIRIALVAFTKGMDGRNLPEGSEKCVNLLYTDYSSTYKKVDKDGITEVLRNVQKIQPDLIVALVHWGSEYNDQFSATQESICALMAELGVDALIGTHPHYVQKMGFDSDSGMFVARSLGDLAGDAEAAGTEYSVLLDLRITKDGATGKTSIIGFDYIPVYQHYSEDGSLQLLRIREAVQAYEDGYIGAVPENVYSAMKKALSRIESRVED